MQTRRVACACTLPSSFKKPGVRVVSAPLIKIAPPRSFKKLDGALRDLDAFDACVFASANAVEYFFRRAAELRLRPQKPAVLLAVGAATARALAKRGWPGAKTPKISTGAALARAFPAPRGKNVLLPQAEGGREEIQKILTRAGARVLRVDAYRSLADARGAKIIKAAAARGLDAVCLASPSAARAFFRAAGRRASLVPAAAIGPTTAAELRRLGARKILVAARPDTRALAQTLRIFFNALDASAPRRRARRA